MAKASSLGSEIMGFGVTNLLILCPPTRKPFESHVNQTRVNTKHRSSKGLVEERDNMIVRVINNDDRNPEKLVELTQEQYDKFKKIQDEHGYIARAPREKDEDVWQPSKLAQELYANPVEEQEYPELIWYH